MRDVTPASVGPRFLIGEHLTLRRIEEGDLPSVRRWYDDSDLRKITGIIDPPTDESMRAWYRGVVEDPSRLWYMIVLDEGDRVVGEAGLLRIVPAWRTADMSIIIGEPDARGRGHGTEVGRLLLDFGFSYLGLHRIAVGVVGFHEEALRFWRALGFADEGIQRDGYRVDGEFHDFVMMSILEDEWRRRSAGSDKEGT